MPVAVGWDTWAAILLVRWAARATGILQVQRVAKVIVPAVPGEGLTAAVLVEGTVGTKCP